MHVIRRLPSDHVLLALVLGAVAFVLFAILTLHSVVAPAGGAPADVPVPAHLVDSRG
jgi:hypothetical protein